MNTTPRTLSLDEIEATQTSLSAAISAALGTPVNARIFRETGRNGTEHLSVTSDPIALTGPTYFMFKSLRVGSFGSMRIPTDQTGTDDEPFAWFELHFDYEHHVSGYNGCGAGIMGRPIILKLMDAGSAREPALFWKAGIL